MDCKLARSREWAARMMCEAQMHFANSYITLTYRTEDLPKDLSLNREHFQLFMKRLRKEVAIDQSIPSQKRFVYGGEGDGLSVFYCGEYGSDKKRPHYHAIIFGVDFADKRFHQRKNGYDLFTSKVLEGLWPYGFSTIGNVTFESCAYVGRYVTKKITGDDAPEHYTRRNEETGEIWQVLPEFGQASLNPAIGLNWLKKYWRDVYPNDYLIVRGGHKMKPPRYFDKVMEKLQPEIMEQVKRKRIREASSKEDESEQWNRVKAKETVLKSKMERLKRELE